MVPISADDDAFGGLALQQVPPRHHTPPTSPPPSPPPRRNDDVNEWGGGLGDILVPRRRNATDSSAYEPLPRSRRREDANDWAGTSLGDVLVTRHRPTPDASAYAPPRRPSRDTQSWSLGDVFARRRPTPAAANHATPNRHSSDYMRDDELTYESLLALDHRLPSPPAVVAARKKLIARAVKNVTYGAAHAATCGQCVVCLDDFRDKDRLKQLPCGHLFHGPCVCKWLEHDPRCPTCRQPIGPA